MDGIFKTAPFPYTQLMTVHGELNGFTLKLVSALLMNKTVESYEHVLMTLNIRLEELTGKGLHPQSVIVDFEAALHRAIGNEFPYAEI